MIFLLLVKANVQMKLPVNSEAITINQKEITMQYSYANIEEMGIHMTVSQFELEFILQEMKDSLEVNSENSKSYTIRKLIREIEESLQKYARTIGYESDNLKQKYIDEKEV